MGQGQYLGCAVRLWSGQGISKMGEIGRMSFTDRDIRPAELDAAKRREIERDIAWLSERRHQFVPVACPACDTDRGEAAFQKDGFQFPRCSACGTIYMSPRAAPKLMAEFY